MSPQDIESLFPNLRRGEYQFTSPEDYHYNCIAWAAGNNTMWWEPSGYRIHYWPPGVTPEYTLESYIRVYTIHGYRPCETAELEPDYEKVAVYVDSLGIPSHAAKQKESGVWMSKLGEYEDIEHDTLEALEGKEPAYGRVAQILKRLRQKPS
jgi:hypothetical protein